MEQCERCNGTGLLTGANAGLECPSCRGDGACSQAENEDTRSEQRPFRHRGGRWSR